MKPATRAIILKYLRTLHSWLGIIVMPWVLIAGFTGFYLNHKQAVLSIIESAPYDESQFDEWPDPKEGTVTQALKLASQNWTDELVSTIEEKTYHDRPAIIVTKPTGQIIVSKPTGHYFLKTNFRRQTFAPDGTLLDTKIYWNSVFGWLHTRGWLGTRFGTLLMDITSIALIVFALSGMFLWWMPRAKKFGRMIRRKA